jgi:hypothetical protein
MTFIKALHKSLKGPFYYKNGRWIASITLLGIESKTFYGMMQKEVQAQFLGYLDQIVRELERAYALLTLLHATLEV